MSKIWSELRRRKVIRVAIAYAVISWVLLQVGAILFPAFHAPSWSIKALTIVLLAGLPITIILSWIFDLTPEGIVITDHEKTPASNTFNYSKLKSIDVNKLSIASIQLAPLSGRVEEVKLLREKIIETKDGRGGIVLISGKPGQGKTRLGEEALSIGGQQGLLALAGHAYEEQGAPYIVPTEILEEITRILPENTLRSVLGNTASEITRLVPDLQRIFPDIPNPIELPPGQQQRYMFNAILDMFIRLSAANPLILLLDDLHWADESSVQLLEHFIPHLTKHPILFIITYRDAEVDLGEPFKRALVKLHKLQSVSHIQLKQLTVDEVDSFLTENSGQKSPAELAELIHRETNGNAFFVLSVFQHLKDEGKLFDESGHWLTDFNDKKIDVPDSVRLLTNERIKKLDESTQEILRTAAILGYRFRIKELEGSYVKPHEILQAIETAEAANLIKPAHVGYGLRYEFVHALARQALLMQISAPRKQRMHVVVAQAIEKSDPMNLEQRAADIAYHLLQAGELADSKHTLTWLSKAGDEATQVIAMDEAVQFYDSALEMLDDESQKAELLHKRAKAKLSLGQLTDFEQDMRASFAIYENLGDDVNAAHLCYELAYIFSWKHQPVEAMEIAQKGLELTGTDATSSRCLLLSTMGFALNIAALTNKSAPFIQEAIEIASSLKNKKLLANALMSQANMHWFNMDGKPLLESAHKASQLYRELNDDWILAQCLWMEQAGLSFAGQYQQSDQIRTELEPIALSHENFGPLLCLELFKSISCQQQGDLEGAVNSLNCAVDYSHKGSLPWAMEGNLSLILLLQGKNSEAREAFDYAYANRMHGGSGEGSNSCFWLLGKAFLNDDDTYNSFLSLQSILPSEDKLNCTGPLMFLLAAVESLSLINKKQEAAELYPQVLKVINEKQLLVPFSLGLTERFAGIAAACGKEWEVADKHFSKALELARTLPHKIEEPRILYWQARMHLDRNQSGDKEIAKQLLSKSRDLSESLGMNGHVVLLDKLAID